MNESETSRIAVVGMGIMGPDIALGFALGGCPVSAYARRPESLEEAGKRIESNLEQLVRESLIPEAESGRVMARIAFTSDLSQALRDVDYATEVVSENVQVKRDMFNRCGEICGKDVVIASNTSSISMDEIASEMRYPERAIVTHWFIPAHLMPVVEVVPGQRTSEATVQQTRALLGRIGKRPVVCKENPAFVHNYVQAALCRAAITLVDRGICSPEDVDAIIENGLALRLPRIGPVRMADYAGLDTALALLGYVYGKTRDPSFEPPRSLIEKVGKGELGIKAGKGYYTYTPEEADRVRRLADRTVIRVKKAMADL